MLEQSGIKWRDLERVLARLGYTMVEEQSSHRVYGPKERGALLILPRAKRSDPVSRPHLAAVKRKLADSELVSREQFDALLLNGGRHT